MSTKAITFGFLIAGISILFGGNIVYQTFSNPSSVQAAQCSEPGCCGEYLRVFQWSCQQSVTRCANWQEPGWVCPNGGPVYPNTTTGQTQCTQFCQNTACVLGCSGGWANECVIDHYDQACQHPDPNTCSATVNLQTCSSQNGGTSCSVSTAGNETRSCWVSGSPNSTPTPSSPPPSGSGTTCWRCVSGTQCAETTSNEPCGCSSCTTYTSRKAVILFEDLDEDGQWEPNSGEKRIVSHNNCTTGTVKVVPGAEIMIDEEVLYQNGCNIGGSEYGGNACAANQSCTFNSGSYWTNPAIGTVQEVEKTCFDEATCDCGTCSWQGWCQSESASGAVCRVNSNYCSGTYSGYDLTTGPHKIVVKETGSYSVNAQMPPGWRLGANTPRNANWTNQNGACDGLLQIGIVQNQEKWCRIDPVDSTITSTAPNNTATFRVTASSTQVAEEVAVVVLTKQANSSANPPVNTTPTSLRLTPAPANTTEVVSTSGGTTRYSYRLNSSGCVTGNGSTCQSSVNIAGLPVGEYYVFCGLNSQNPIRCSGNPNCSYENMGGTVDCGANGYTSCSSTGVYNGINYTYDDNAIIRVQCNAQCPVACGQPDGCNTGNYCGTSSTGTPPTPIPLASQNITVNTNQAQHYATLSWQAGTYTGTPPTPPTTRYDLVIARQDGAVTNSATAGQAFNQCESTCDDFASTCNTTFNGSPIRCVKHNSIINLSHSYLPQLSIGNKIRVAVRAVNQSCSSFGNTAWGGFSNPVDYTLVQNVAGNFYADPGLTAAGSPVCLGTPTATSVPVGSTMQATPPNSSAMPATSVSGTNYTYLSLPYSPASWVEPKADLQLTIDNSGNPPESQIVCTCPDGCRYLDVINSPHTGVNFFLTTVDLSTESWWQTVNGLLYAARDTILSVIPDDCKADGTGTCVPYLITQDRTISDEASLLLSAGIPLSGTGDVADTDKTVWLTERTPQARGSEATAHTQLERENFAYFQSKYDYENLTTLPTLSGTAVGLPTVNTVYKYSGNLQVRPGASPWRINAGETLIIFVEGTITFQGEDPASSAALFQVEEGGFLAFISSGNIVFDANVGNTDPANLSPSVSGVFISDGSITIEATSDSSLADKHFVGAGTFVAWDEANSGAGMIFNRNYADSGLGALDNNLYPTETFLYRPDFAYYMPEEMRSTDLFWQEVN